MGKLTFLKQFSLGTFAFLGFCAIQLNIMSSGPEVANEKVRTPEIQLEKMEVAKNESNHVQNS